jgi:parvulin-like peptidyl-prolyl isomerase
MAGASFQVQIRQILVDDKEAADLLMETINTPKSGTERVQLLMKMAEKYSKCSSKNDGGNLGWLEMGWNIADPRVPRGGFKKLENEELYDAIDEGLKKKTLLSKIAFGPVKTHEGYHLVIVANEFHTNRVL